MKSNICGVLGILLLPACFIIVCYGMQAREERIPFRQASAIEQAISPAEELAYINRQIRAIAAHISRTTDPTTKRSLAEYDMRLRREWSDAMDRKLLRDAKLKETLASISSN